VLGWIETIFFLKNDTFQSSNIISFELSKKVQSNVAPAPFPSTHAQIFFFEELTWKWSYFFIVQSFAFILPDIRPGGNPNLGAKNSVTLSHSWSNNKFLKNVLKIQVLKVFLRLFILHASGEKSMFRKNISLLKKLKKYFLAKLTNVLNHTNKFFGGFKAMQFLVKLYGTNI
jgi:hypothetical protein